MDTLIWNNERTTYAAEILEWKSENDLLFKDGFSNLEINRHRFNRIFELVEGARSKSVADIGSFPGFGIAYFEDYTAIGKIGPEYARGLEKLSVPYQEIDIEEQGFSSRADLILFQEVIEHLRRPHQSLVNIYESIAPGALLYMTTNNIFYYGYILKLIAQKPILDDISSEGQFYPGHCRYYSAYEMAKTLEDIGFEVLKANNLNLLPPLKYYRKKSLGAIKYFLSAMLPSKYATHIELLVRKPN